jgi:serine/threonine protein kinase
LGAFIPEVFGKYYLVDKIAVGGMAEIFKAKSFSHAGFEKLLVIKRILAHHSENEEFVAMFIDEAKISAQLQHPNIVHVYDFGQLHTNCYIAMECVDGKDIKRILKKMAERRKLLPVEYAIFIAQQVALGLEHAHTKTNLQGEALDIIHRDMSPANVLVGYSGDIKLADFGIAKAKFSGYDTEVGVLKGKFEYMSPEQARGEPVTQQSDIFSLGIILYEMLTGRRLFKAKSEIATLEKIKALDLKPPSHYNQEANEDIDALVMGALQKQTGDRYATAHAFEQALSQYLHTTFEPQTQRRLSEFLCELFTDERTQERADLEEGSRIALELHEQEPEIELQPEWEESTSHGGPTLRTDPPPRSVGLILLGVCAAAALVLALVVGLQPDPAPGPTLPPVASKSTTGAISLLLEPANAVVFKGEEKLGVGPTLALEGLEPGTWILRFEAQDHVTKTETLTIEAGTRTMLPVRLEKVSKRTVAAKPPRLVFESSPSGAQVFVDNRSVGITPITWSEGRPDSSYRARYTLEGHTALDFQVTTPGSGERDTVTRTLEHRPMGRGGVNVNVRPGWAYVYVDGKKVGETPLTAGDLAAGNHTIRVVNEATGLDDSRTVRVRPGDTATVLFDTP